MTLTLMLLGKCSVQLAQDAILSDSKQLASQFVARLYEVYIILMFFYPFPLRLYFLCVILKMRQPSFLK